jgi:predicted ATP-grasp superfamily ATP-dependent carboligase
MVAYRKLSLRCRSVLVQEFIPGRGAGYFALMHHGRLHAEFAHRRIRDVRPTGSGSSVRESTRPDARLRDASRRLLEALNWHGVAMVEFRVRPDGTPVFLELNGRFWNSLALAVNAGVDFPRLLASMASGAAPTAAVPAYPPGVRCRWLLGDVRNLIEVLKGAPRGFPGRYPSRLRAVTEFMTPVPGEHFDNFRLDDPLPELGDWLDFLLRRLKRPSPAALAAPSPALVEKELHVQRRYSHS